LSFIKNGVFFSASSYEKRPFLAQLKQQIFSPSYFVAALTQTTLMPCYSAGPKGFWTFTKKFGQNQKF